MKVTEETLKLLLDKISLLQLRIQRLEDQMGMNE